MGGGGGGGEGREGGRGGEGGGERMSNLSQCMNIILCSCACTYMYA